MFIGVVTKDWTGYQTNYYVGQDANGWSMGAYQGWTRVNAGNKSSQLPNTGASYTNGDTVTVKLGNV
jgi:hypothetical protein